MISEGGCAAHRNRVRAGCVRPMDAKVEARGGRAQQVRASPRSQPRLAATAAATAASSRMHTHSSLRPAAHPQRCLSTALRHLPTCRRRIRAAEQSFEAAREKLGGGGGEWTDEWLQQRRDLLEWYRWVRCPCLTACTCCATCSHRIPSRPARFAVRSATAIPPAAGRD